MRPHALHATAMGLLFAASAPVMATGFVNLPTTGVPAPGGTSAYTLCNTTGEFGSNPNGSTPPTQSANNTCAVFRNNRNSPPLSGYNRVYGPTNRDIRINNRSIGTLIDEVWRSGSNCIYSAHVSLTNVDYDPNTAGTQSFEVNDIARAGWRAATSRAAAYHFENCPPSNPNCSRASDDVIYRAGLTFTAVAHPDGAPDQPLTSAAPISTNWVDFTTDINGGVDPDGSSVPDSSWVFVRVNRCPASGTPLSNAIRLRQMSQEDQPELEISLPGYAPSGANTTP